MIPFLISLITCLFIVISKEKKWMIGIDPTNGIQKIHKEITPRIGGVGIITGIIAAYFSEMVQFNTISVSILIVGAGAFIIGFAEDLTKKINIKTRLIVTILSGVAGSMFTEVALHRIGITLITPLFEYNTFAILFTAIAIAGIANAFNIVDGLNGLVGFLILIAMSSIAMINLMVGDIDLALTCMTICASIVGFLLFNWPFGKIFLGDGGAYFCGIAVGWCCVLMVERNPTISPFAAILVCIHPVTEVFFSIYRRFSANKNPAHADTQHLHSLVYRRYFSKNKKFGCYKNSVAGLSISMLSIPPSIFAIYLSERNLMCAVGCLVFITLYVILYLRVIKFKWIWNLNKF